MKDNGGMIGGISGSVSILNVLLTYKMYQKNVRMNKQTGKRAERKKLEKEIEDKIETFEKDLDNITKNFPRDHTTYKGVQKSNKSNASHFLDKILSKNADTDIKSYFNGESELNGKKISLETLLNLSYMQCLGN